MVSYINQLFPFLENSDFIKTSDETVDISNIYCPINFEDNLSDNNQILVQRKRFQAVRVQPCNVLLINEPESVVNKIKSGVYGTQIRLNTTEYDYVSVASQLDVTDNRAYLHMNKGYEEQEVVTDAFVNAASNGTTVDEAFLMNVGVPRSNQIMNLKDWLSGYSEEEIMESTDMFDDLLSDAEAGKSTTVETEQTKDYVYKWLDSYFALPEGVSATQGGREVVPLLIGPTGVFKSSTVKELCKKYDYRLVDFRVAFTSRLDYSGLFQMGEVDGKKYSYACPMEEIVTCSDGFREYCRRAYDKVSQILKDGYITKGKASDGEKTESLQEPLTDTQRKTLENVLAKYKEYMKVPVLFLDEITRCKDIGVEGLLTEMLNQKRFNNMQLQGCKFVAATNLNLKSRTNARHNDMMDELDEMYDVNQDIDVAYSNRFLPLRVQPEDVQDRWFVWASKEKSTSTGTRQNIHPLVIEYLNTPQGKQMVYNDTPVLDALEQGLTENETKSQSYPNYRTWEMLSDYLYKVDRDYELDKKEDPNNAVKVYRRNVINGLISSWGADRFIPFLEQKGYKDIDSVIGEVDDEFTDFLENSLDAGVPALMIGPSSMGKTTRVKSYVRKERERTGLEPVLINIDLSSKDVVDLMGMPSKVSILDYVAGDMSDIPDVGKELSDIVESVTKEERYGLSDILTVRAPDKSIKDLLVKAKEEGREVIFMFDECNRVKNTSVLSAMFEVISDARMSGVDFSDMRDRVKVVAACNMAHSEMDDAGDYSSAGAIDPALAARFSVFWKKKYDEKDVRSWIAYMEQEKAEGRIDGTVLEYFKNLEPERAIEIIASVEKRQLAYAEPSTRNLHQLSMDIKSMRGKSESEDSKLFYGKLLFDDMTRGEFGDIYDTVSSSTHDDVDVSNKIVKLIAELQDQRDVWDSQIANRKVTLNSRELTANDLMDNLKKCEEELRKLIIAPLDSNGQKKLKALNRLAVDLLRACNDLDDMTAQSREAIFETYVGEEFAREFTPYFNENFGSGNDTEITIEMLSDKSLVKPFFKKYRSAHSGMMEEKYEDSMLDLMREYMDVHGKSLQPDVYAAFIDGISNSLASSDGMERILKKTDNSVDDLFVEAEKVGDAWILGLLAATRITQSDIDVVRSKLSGKVQGTGRKRKSVVL